MSQQATTKDNIIIDDKNQKFKSYFIARLTRHKLLIFLNIVFAVFSFIQLGFFSYGFDGNNYDINALVAGFSAVGFAVMAYVFGISSFNYCHDRNVSDMVLSLPVNRKQRFFGDFLSGLTGAVAPFIASYIISLPMFLLLLRSADFEEIMSALLKIAVYGSITLVMIYALTVFAGALCGRLFEAVSVPIMLGIIIPVTMWLFVLNAYGNTYGLASDLAQFMEPLIGSSPFTFALWAIGAVNDLFNFAYVWVQVLLALITTALFIIGAYFLNQRRAAEKVGKPFTTKIFYNSYVSLITFCITAAFMYFIVRSYTISRYLEYYSVSQYDFYQNIAPVLIFVGFLVTAFAYFIFEAINNKGFKNPLKVTIRWFVTVIASVALCLGLYVSGGFGAVDYIPNSKDVASATIDKPNAYYSEGIYFDGKTIREIKFKEKENMELIKEFHKRALTLKNKDLSYGSTIGNSAISYALNSGKPVDRTYPLTEYTIVPLQELFTSDECIDFKLEYCRKIIAEDGTRSINITKITRWSEDARANGDPRVVETANAKLEEPNQELLEAILEAYEKDLRAEAPSEIFKSSKYKYALGIYNEPLHESEYYGRYEGGSRNYASWYTIEVKSHYANLNALIDELNLNYESRY